MRQLSQLEEKNRAENQIKLKQNLYTMKYFLTRNKLTMNRTMMTVVEIMVPQKRLKPKEVHPYWTPGVLKEKSTELLPQNTQGFWDTILRITYD